MSARCAIVLTLLLTSNLIAQEPPVSFRTDVMAVLSKGGCNAGTCHGNFNGKNGFRLSLRGENALFDYDSLTRDTQGRRVNPLDPEASLLLQKPAGIVPHEGGIRFPRDSVEYRILRDWIAGGLKLDGDETPRVTRLEVEPRDRILLNGQRQVQMRARAHFSDGSGRDVTSMAVYEPSQPLVTVSPAGLVTASGAGEVTLTVRYLDQQVTCRLAFVPPRPDFVWRPYPVANCIDTHIQRRLQALQIEPSPLADDATFVRRVYLDVCGILPTPAEARAFLADQRPDKRARLIDQLLERPEYADFWALKWADLLRNEEKAVDPKGVRHFQAWLRQAVSEDLPLDQFAFALLTGRGSTYENPAANYYRTNLEPQRAAETTALLFLGIRISCAKCHNHPFDRWTQEDYHGLSAFFARVRTRIINNARKDRLDKHELKGELIVWLDREGEVPHPQTGAPMPPRLPGGLVPRIAADGDRLRPLAEWITRPDNPWFARVMANRIWYHLMGRGLVEPVDDFRASNPPSHPELLDALARELVDQRFSQKHLIRTILRSSTYQLSSVPTRTNAEDEGNFARVQPRLLTAEQLLDAMAQVTGVPERFAGLPVGTRAAQLPGVEGAPPFLKTFGRPDRLLACECERQSSPTLNQAFTLITGEALMRKLEESPRLTRLLEKKATSAELIAELYLAALSRYPTAREIESLSARLDRSSDRRRAAEDLLWALLNSKEFLLRR